MSTPMIRRLAACVALLPALLAGALTALSAAAHASGTVSGPAITIEDADVQDGDLIWVTLRGFEAGSVTLAVCGNEARRGATDCNMIKSKGVRLQSELTETVARFGVSTPPADCPCIIRASSPNNDEVAVVPIKLYGHPIGPLIDPPNLSGPFVALAIHAESDDDGVFAALRPSLGGPIGYDVTITVKNLMPQDLHSVRLSGSMGRDADDNLADIDFGTPGEIGVGQTWTKTVHVVVPSPSFGGREWRAIASGAGPTVKATTHTRHRPWLLIVVTMLLVIDIGLLLMRLAIRRRLARGAEHDAGPEEGSDDPPPEPLDERLVLSS